MLIQISPLLIRVHKYDTLFLCMQYDSLEEQRGDEREKSDRQHNAAPGFQVCFTHTPTPTPKPTHPPPHTHTHARARAINLLQTAENEKWNQTSDHFMQREHNLIIGQNLHCNTSMKQRNIICSCFPVGLYNLLLKIT